MFKKLTDAIAGNHHWKYRQYIIVATVICFVLGIGALVLAVQQYSSSLKSQMVGLAAENKNLKSSTAELSRRNESLQKSIQAIQDQVGMPATEPTQPADGSVPTTEILGASRVPQNPTVQQLLPIEPENTQVTLLLPGKGQELLNLQGSQPTNISVPVVPLPLAN